jgi:transposase
MKYSGIDLHSNNCLVTVIDDSDKVVAQRRLPNDLVRIIAFLSPWREELAGVVVESTYNWYWLVDGLQEAGFNVKLANTGAIRKYDGLKHSGNEADARQLAHLLRLDRMSCDGGGKSVKGPGASATSLNGMPFAVARAVKRIACGVSQQGVGAAQSAATSL